jgi:hypothetical protein
VSEEDGDVDEDVDNEIEIESERNKDTDAVWVRVGETVGVELIDTVALLPWLVTDAVCVGASCELLNEAV